LNIRLKVTLAAVTFLATAAVLSSGGAVAHAAGQSFAITASGAATSSVSTSLNVPLGAAAASGDELVVIIGATVPLGNALVYPSAVTAYTGSGCTGTSTSLTAYLTDEADGSRTTASDTLIETSSSDNCVNVTFGTAVSASVTVQDITPTNAGTFSVLASTQYYSHANTTGQNWNSANWGGPYSTVSVALDDYVVEGPHGISTTTTTWSESNNIQSTVPSNSVSTEANGVTTPISGTPGSLSESQTTSEQNAQFQLALNCT
jgi:hypothetical protein